MQTRQIGVTGLQGFIGFLFFHIIVSLGLVLKSNFQLLVITVCIHLQHVHSG